MKCKSSLPPFRSHRLHAALALAIPMLAMSANAKAQSGLTDIGALAGVDYSYSTGVSADGSVVVGFVEGNNGGYAFNWTAAGGMVSLNSAFPLHYSEAWGVSADGSVVVGDFSSPDYDAQRPFRWTAGTGMVALPVLWGSGRASAMATSADGSVVVGYGYTADAAAEHAFLWSAANWNTVQDLGTLGGKDSYAAAVSADGSVVVGASQPAGGNAWTSQYAFRWTSAGGMVNLGALGGSGSSARGVSADGNVVVGSATTAGDASTHAFRWTAASGMTDLGTLGGDNSRAAAISGNGQVVVGAASTSSATRAFRWTQATGMQSVEDWLRASGVTVASDTSYAATATNNDGSVVVGYLENESAFIARGAGTGQEGGLITLADVQNSLAGTARANSMALSSNNTLIHGAHSRPLARRVAAGQNAFWLAGDWGRDDHGERDGDLGLAEFGFGRNFGPAQVNVSLGQTWAKQHQLLDGQTKTDGSYLLLEALVPVSGNISATLGAYRNWGDAKLKRGYINAGAQDFSRAKADIATWGLRARVDLENDYTLAGAAFTPYADLSYAEAKLDAYTETGGGFPAHFDARKEKATDLHLGVNVTKPLTQGINLLATLEAVHRFEKNGPHTTGQVLGLFGFDLPGQKNDQNWLRAGFGVEGKLAGGNASLSLNATTQGETANYWLAANWQKSF